MGLLFDLHSGRTVALAPHTVVGRSSACAIVIDDPRASAEHAALVWSGQGWELRDLGSLNGTWIDGRRLASGERAALSVDARLGFGGADETWMLIEDRPAGPAARNEATGERVCSTSGLLALPSAEDPRATIFRREDGQWRIELGPELRAIADLDRVVLDGVAWTVYLPRDLGLVPDTLRAEGAALTLRDATLWFAPSLDEEDCEVRVHVDAGAATVLPSRSSHYLLLTLARARIKDADAGVVAGEQGWIYASELAAMLRYTAERLNIEIFRARTVFAKLGFTDASQLLERRASSRQIRIGIARLHVIAHGAPAPTRSG